MLLAQFAEPDPGLADMTAAGEVDPGAHHPKSLSKCLANCVTVRPPAQSPTWAKCLK
jgi:hypothetical protein